MGKDWRYPFHVLRGDFQEYVDGLGGLCMPEIVVLPWDGCVWAQERGRYTIYYIHVLQFSQWVHSFWDAPYVKLKIRFGSTQHNGVRYVHKHEHKNLYMYIKNLQDLYF